MNEVVIDNNNVENNIKRQYLFRPSAVENQSLLIQEFSSGGICGDVNNDGLFDVIITTPCKCRSTNIYIQKKDNNFAIATHKYGLTNIPAGLDAVWVDYNNDGKLDLCTIIEGYLKIFKNIDNNNNNFLEINLKGKNIVGTTVALYSDNLNVTRTVTSGRGILMQDPLRLHFGLDRFTSIDSLIVHWPSGHTERLLNVVANRIITISQNQHDDDTYLNLQLISVHPNPASDRVFFELFLLQPSNVKLEIYSLNGDRIIAKHYSETTIGTNIVEWDGKNSDGSLIPQGVYLFYLSDDKSKQYGKLTITR